MKPKFQGTDYEELAELWGIETDSRKLIAAYIMESMYTTYDDEFCYVEVLDSAVKGAMVEYLDEFIKKQPKYHYGNAIFIGLRATADEDDSTFAQYFVDLLSHMWC